MKTLVLSAALIGFSTFAAAACDYGDTSAKVDTKITVASIESAQKSLPQTTNQAKKADEKATTGQSTDVDQD